jgi:DNA mismatch repair protein MutS2
LATTPDEIDLHGLTIDEAIPRVDEFLYRSFRARLFRVWIIHGKGTGILRSAVRDYLTRHPLVLLCTVAEGKRGGLGATQIDIKY